MSAVKYNTGSFLPDKVCLEFIGVAENNPDTKVEGNKHLRELEATVQKRLQADPEQARLLRMQARRAEIAGSLESATTQLATFEAKRQSTIAAGFKVDELSAMRHEIRSLTTEKDDLADELAMFDSAISSSEAEIKRLFHQHFSELRASEKQKADQLLQAKTDKLVGDLLRNPDIQAIMELSDRSKSLDTTPQGEGRFILSRQPAKRQAS